MELMRPKRRMFFVKAQEVYWLGSVVGMDNGRSPWPC